MMNRCTYTLSAALVALAWAGMTSAQTTRPAQNPETASWASTVDQVARATEKADLSAIVGAMARDAQVRAFEAPEPVTVRTLVDSTADWKLLGSHAYEYPPATLAADIAADVKASELIPDVEKRKIIPIDDAERNRANTTAADWVAQTLGAERNQLVGVAVFWHVRMNRPMFVLMKGQPAGDAFAVKVAVFGDPMVRRVQASSR
jgi:hypothetical protein